MLIAGDLGKSSGGLTNNGKSPGNCGTEIFVAVEIIPSDRLSAF